MGLIFALAFFELFEFASLTVQFSLIGIDLVLLIGLLYLLSLDLIADQSTRSQSQNTANGSASPRMADRGSDDPACRCAAQSADSGTLFARR